MFDHQNGIAGPAFKADDSGSPEQVPQRAKPNVERRQIRGKSDEEILEIIKAEIVDRKAEMKLVRKDIRKAERERREAQKAAQLKEIEQLIAGHDPELVKSIIRDGLNQV